MKVTFLGDTHGDWIKLDRIIKKQKGNLVVHVGDVGLGFPAYQIWNKHTQKFEIKNDPNQFPDNFKFIRGNHDNPEICRNYPNYLGDYGYDDKLGLFYISGAWSIDVTQRTPGIDWWHEEELDYEDLNKAINLYEKIRPNVVVSHTCPQNIANIISKGKSYKSKTEKALDDMFKIHKPKYWIFGHWHIIWRQNILGTNFVCCPINGTFELDLSKIKDNK